MNTEDALALSRLNASFYERYSSSFARTRNRPWEGWRRVLARAGQPAAVLDLACGNLRFQRNVRETFPYARVNYYCVDSCDALVGETAGVTYQSLDIVPLLLKGSGALAEALDAPACDLSVSFGFMHHVPTQAARCELLRALAAKTKPGGFAALSFWRFADDAKQREKARTKTESYLRDHRLQLEDNDYLLGWNADPAAVRYCHSFTDGEIGELLHSASGFFKVVERFISDGFGNRQNDYAVLVRL